MSKKQPKLTPKQAKFVKGVAEGKSGTQAALDAYETTDYKTASVIATENLEKPSIREALEPILAKHQIDLDNAIAPIGKGLRATKMNEYTGEVTEDLGTQLKASDRALKLLGVGNTDGQTININFNQVAEEQRKRYGL